MFFFCAYLFFPSVLTYEVTTKPSTQESTETLNFPVNTTVLNSTITHETNTSNVVTQRIIQPMQGQNIERIFETPLSSNNSIKTDNKTSKLDNFKPSPQLDTYYEFNKFPVIPAIPEAKTLGGFSSSGNFLNTWNEKPSNKESWSNNREIPNPWYENSGPQNLWNQNIKINPNPATEQPWVTRVKFPSEVVKENPYNFVGGEEKLNSYHPAPAISFTTTTEGFSFNKPVDTTNRNKPSTSLWQKLMGGGNGGNKNNVAAQKTFFDYNIMEKPPHHAPVKDYNDYGVSSHGSPNPLGKIIKILTAIIPIGLLISALTPTVISVTSVNDTQSRYRIDDPKHQDIANRLASSLKYAEQFRSCEDKILCELLVTASSSKNSEEHIKNLLDTFTEHEDLQSKKEDLLKVFEAVKKEDCSSIVCKSIRNPS